MPCARWRTASSRSSPWVSADGLGCRRSIETAGFTNRGRPPGTIRLEPPDTVPGPFGVSARVRGARRVRGHRDQQDRHRAREPGRAVPADAPQRRLDGARSPGGSRRLGGQGEDEGRLVGGRRAVSEPRPAPGQAPHVHERVRDRGSQGARPGASAADRDARRRRRLRAAIRQAALPRGWWAGRAQRPQVDHRRARVRGVQPAAGRDRRAGWALHRPRPDEVRAGRAPAARRAARRGGRRGRGVGARGHEQGCNPVQRVRASTGGPGPHRATGRGRWPAPARMASGEPRPAGERSAPRSTHPTTEIADERQPHAAARPEGLGAARGRAHAGRAADPESEAGTPYQRGVPAEADAVRPGARGRSRRPAFAAGGTRPAPPESRRIAAAPRRHRRVRGPSRATRTDRGPGIERGPARRGHVRAARREELPRGCARARGGRADLLGRARFGDRRSRGGGAGRVGRRPGGGGRPRAKDCPRLRAERAGRRRDGREGGGPVGVAQWRRPDPRRERPGAAPAHDRAGRPARAATRAARRRARLAERPAPRAAGARLHAGARGGGTRRVRAPWRHRRRLPAVGGAAGPDRIVRRRDRFAARVRPDRPAHDRLDRAGGAAARVGVPRAGRRRGHAERAAWRGRQAAAGAPRAGPRAARRCPGRRARRGSRRISRRGGRRRGRDLGAAARAGDRARPPRSGDAVRARRARRPGRRGRVPVAPGGRAARRPPRRGGAAAGLAADAPAAARLETADVGREDPRAHLGIRGKQRDRGRRQIIRRPVRVARAGAPAGTRRSDRGGGRALARGGRRPAREREGSHAAANRDRVGPGATPRGGARKRRASLPGSRMRSRNRPRRAASR